MNAINFINKYKKPYIGIINNLYYDNNNHNYDYYYNKYYYNIKYKKYNNENTINILKINYNEEEIIKEFNEKKLNYNNYYNIKINDYNLLLNFINDYIIFDDYLLNEIIKKICNDINNIKYIMNICCKNIIINISNNYINDYINDNKQIYYKNIILQLYGDNIKYKKSSIKINEIKCKNFISTEYINCYRFWCNNFINYNKPLYIYEFNIYHKFINYYNIIDDINNINNIKHIINCNYYNNDLRNIIDLINNYKISSLFIYKDNTNIISNNNIKNIIINNKNIQTIILQSNIKNLLLDKNIFINFNNYTIENININFTLDILNFNNYSIEYLNKLNINEIYYNDLKFIKQLDYNKININELLELINLLLKFKSINKLHINNYYLQYDIINKNNLIIDFKNLKLNELKLENLLNLINIKNINKITIILQQYIKRSIFINNNKIINNINNLINDKFELFNIINKELHIYNKNNKFNLLKIINNDLYFE